MYGYFAAGVIAVFLADLLLPKNILGVPTLLFVAGIWICGWIFIQTKLPKCPICGMRLFSVIEAKGIPLFSKSWVGTHCVNCGTKYE